MSETHFDHFYQGMRKKEKALEARNGVLAWGECSGLQDNMGIKC